MGINKTWDNGGSGDKYSTGDNWNPDGAVATDDDIIHDVTSTANADADISQANSMDVQAAYTGLITQSAELSFTSTFNIAGGAGMKWITNSNDLYVDGNFLVDGSSDGVAHALGATIYLGADADVDNGAGTHYFGVVRFHHSKATPTLAKTHLVLDWSRANSRTEDMELSINQTLQLNGRSLFRLGLPTKNKLL